MRIRQAANLGDLRLRGRRRQRRHLFSHYVGNDNHDRRRIDHVTAIVIAEQPDDAALEQIVGRPSLEPLVTAARRRAETLIE